MWSLHGAQLARRIVSEEGAGRIVGPRLGYFHLRLLRTDWQGDISRGRLFALGAISVFQRLTRGGMESLRGDVADRARRPASASFQLGPKADYKLDWESWRPVGLGGTGSFDVIVENAFVPDYRVLRFSDAVGSTGPGAESNKNPLYRISLLTGVAYALAMPAVGAASGSLERFIDENKVRQTHGAVVLGGKKIADFQTIQKRVGEAAARIDACRLVAQHAVDAAERQVREDGKSSMPIRLLSRRSQSFIANEAKTAIDLIFDAAGGRCLQQGHPLQRAWRDVAAINHHISLNFDAVMSMYGQFVFGLPLEGQY